MYYVIGSGPSGIACAKAFADRGLPVTILDAGLTLEPEREASRASLADSKVSDWPEPEILMNKDGTMPIKLVHGSDYPYRLAPGATAIYSSGRMSLQGSYAFGGLSNVWGSAMLPFRQEDITDWPVTEAELRSAYGEVLKLLPLAAEQDNLAELFPLHSESFTPLRRSHQIQRFMHSLAKNRSKLDANNIYFGAARLAVDAAGKNSESPCIYCGRCLHGCPHELIYSTRQSLQSLRSSEKIEYRNGITVKSIEEGNGSVFIHGAQFDGAPCTLEGKRVFLAAGVLHSTMILLRAQKLYDHPVNIKDAQYFLFPMLQYSASPNVQKEQLHTLCQAFIEILDPKVSSHTVHLQIYSYNDHLAKMLDSKLGILKHLFPKNLLFGRFLLVQAYLHSAHSAVIAATLRRQEGTDALYLEPRENAQTKEMILRAIRKLRSVTGSLQAMPVTPLLQIAEPGLGFHTGGSFPMAHDPGPGQTDRLGRPFGMRQLHVVDSTVLPSIPATTITLPVMANAYRIGAEVSMLDNGGSL
jgi:choline dehydrogenase-like flavoprotein